MEACENACLADAACLQYSYDKVCLFNDEIRLGFKQEIENGEKVMISGWDLDKIDEIKSAGCKKVRWPMPSYGRRS